MEGDKRSGTIHHERCLVIELKVFHAPLHMRTPRGVTPVSDKKTRLLEAERALHGLEMQVEQYRVHIEELAQHPSEATKARAMLENITTELALQRKYYDLLQKAAPVEDRPLNGSRVA